LGLIPFGLVKDAILSTEILQTQVKIRIGLMAEMEMIPSTVATAKTRSMAKMAMTNFMADKVEMLCGAEMAMMF
jgi:hypothetical protein